MRLLVALSIGLISVACASQSTPYYGTIPTVQYTPFPSTSTPDYGLPVDGDYQPEPFPSEVYTEASPEPSATPSPLVTAEPLDAAEDNEEASPNPNVPIDNFHVVAEGIFRGARPTEEGLAQLKALGVKTVVNLEWSKKIFNREKALVEGLGMKAVHIPMNVITPPSTAKVDQLHAILTDPKQLPAFFHCKQGRDRTGLMGYTYRVKIEGWDPKSAYEEAKGYGFRTYLLGLRGFMYWYGKKFGA